MPRMAACSTMLFRWPAGAAAAGRSCWVPQYPRHRGGCHQPRRRAVEEKGPPQLQSLPECGSAAPEWVSVTGSGVPLGSSSIPPVACRGFGPG